MKNCAAITLNNYCSRKCFGAAVAKFNSLSPKRKKAYQECLRCHKQIVANQIFCSNNCWAQAHTVTNDFLIKELVEWVRKMGRPPTQREFKHKTSCYKRFGSWNKTLIAAALKPYRSLDQRMYRRSRCIAVDGHKCDSISELIIDNWLSEHMIEHFKGSTYPIGKYLADWSLSSGALVEYFGLANDSARYDQAIVKKRQICLDHQVKLIAIFPEDLYPKIKLATKLRRL